MRIKGLTPILLSDLKTQKLKNTTVVIDGQSVFFRLYQHAHIPYAFGCESDKFANFLETYLDKFKKANLKCHFVFKGGHTNEERLENHFEAENRLHGQNYVPSKEDIYDDIVKPLFAKNIWFQTLKEMGFDYVICNGDHITECIALALKLKCPVIGNNMQYFFSQVEYIPEINTTLDENNNLLCGIYTFSNFLKTYNLTEEKIILFIMMTDHHILGENVCNSFFANKKKMLTRYGKINLRNFLTWLSKRSTGEVSAEIFKVLSETDKALYKEKKTHLEMLVQERKKSDTKMTLYVTDENKAKFAQSDPDWFEKGVFFDFIAIPYINLYRYKIVKASNFIEDYEQENSIMVSIDIVKYALDLLKNFEGGEMNVEHKKSNHLETGQPLKYDLSIRKPDYEATLSVFENGWDNIKELKLFKHFITESLQTFDFARLHGAPADSKLLLITLVYFSRKKPEAKLEIYSILLSYVMLDVVYEKLNKNADAFKSNEENLSEKPFLDSFTDKDLVTVADCEVAGSLMSTYFKLRGDERCKLFDRKTLHPLVEFTRCLEELNYLNQLCGSEFDPTIYRKTFNGTFVYKVLSAMKGQEDGLEFIKKKLSPAPTVLAFLTGMLGIYESILYEY